MNPVQGALVIQSIVLGSAAALLAFAIAMQWMSGDTRAIPMLTKAFYVLGVLALASGIATGWAGAL